MREYSRDRSVETSRYTAQFPTSAQLRKLQKFDMTIVQQHRAAGSPVTFRHHIPEDSHYHHDRTHAATWKHEFLDMLPESS